MEEVEPGFNVPNQVLWVFFFIHLFIQVTVVANPLHTFTPSDNSTQSVHLLACFSGSERKLESLEETLGENMQNSTQFRIKQGTQELWSSNATHCVSVPSCIFYLIFLLISFAFIREGTQIALPNDLLSGSAEEFFSNVYSIFQAPEGSFNRFHLN